MNDAIVPDPCSPALLVYDLTDLVDVGLPAPGLSEGSGEALFVYGDYRLQVKKGRKKSLGWAYSPP